ncbi:hypothetical protein ABK040_014464 [Willaertia magna]
MLGIDNLFDILNVKVEEMKLICGTYSSSTFGFFTENEVTINDLDAGNSLKFKMDLNVIDCKMSGEIITIFCCKRKLNYFYLKLLQTLSIGMLCDIIIVIILIIIL